mmetsp:Transcript_22321/g.63404  ORF Transcript_22321/g.63404 Transcript_22321/m.63404 type:complete len:234 (+) Transcript_22321:215-916(+)
MMASAFRDTIAPGLRVARRRRCSRAWRAASFFADSIAGSMSAASLARPRRGVSRKICGSSRNPAAFASLGRGSCVSVSSPQLAAVLHLGESALLLSATPTSAGVFAVLRSASKGAPGFGPPESGSSGSVAEACAGSRSSAGTGSRVQSLAGCEKALKVCPIMGTRLLFGGVSGVLANSSHNTAKCLTFPAFALSRANVIERFRAISSAAMDRGSMVAILRVFDLGTRSRESDV